MTEPGPPSTRVHPHELPSSLREAGLTNWIREPLDDALDRRRRVILPPAAATIGTPDHTQRELGMIKGPAVVGLDLVFHRGPAPTGNQ